MEQKRRVHAPGERAVDGLVLVVESVFHHHLRRDGAGGLVHVVIERDVGVTVDDAGGEIFSLGIDYGGAGGGVYGFADGGNLAILDIDFPVFDVAVGDGHQSGVFDDDVAMGGLGKSGERGQ